MFALRTGLRPLSGASPPLATRILFARLASSEAGAGTTTRKSKVSTITTSPTAAGEYFKTFRPFTPGVRHLKILVSPHLYAGRPVRALTAAFRKNGGRNNSGRITTRHRGGGHRQRLRDVDFLRREDGEWDVVRIEYDPGRSGHVALVKRRIGPGDRYAGKVWSYILATEGMRAGDTVRSFMSGIPPGFVRGLAGVDLSKALTDEGDGLGGTEAEAASRKSLALGMFRSLTLKSGNVLPLRLIPPGIVVHNIGLRPDAPGLLVRAAGAGAQVMAHEPDGRYTLVRLQSGEVRKIGGACCATIGRVSNPLWKHRMLGKAGRRRWLGWRPEVRGMAMNAKDHPHGGGRGKSKSNKHPVSIWGWGTQGTRTRKPGPKGPKNSNKMVVKERPRGVDKRR